MVGQRAAYHEAHEGEVPAQAGIQIGDFTAEALRSRSKEFLLKKYSELCVLCGREKKLVFAKISTFKYLILLMPILRISSFFDFFSRPAPLW